MPNDTTVSADWQGWGMRSPTLITAQSAVNPPWPRGRALRGRQQPSSMRRPHDRRADLN